MTTWPMIERLVVTRADHRCEYCRMHQIMQGATFHIEHIIPRSRGGATLPETLALACPSCNLHKADRIAVSDSETGTTTALFHPREQAWPDHFEWRDLTVVGRTSTGRATIAALQLNAPRRLLVRQAEQQCGLFPPRV